MPRRGAAYVCYARLALGVEGGPGPTGRRRARDAFLVRAVAMHGASARQRMVSPRKAYPVDLG
ncbi:MAG TPA: hypothetical protein VGA25_07715 [Burkholderiales bacterium]|jgi:hypothetical protein